MESALNMFGTQRMNKIVCPWNVIVLLLWLFLMFFLFILELSTYCSLWY